MEKKDNKLTEILNKLSIKKIGIDKIIIGLLVGLFLMLVLIPDSSTKKANKSNTTEQSNQISSIEGNDNEEYIAYMEERLVKVLSDVDGVGRVNVMITLRSSKETVVNKDEKHEETIKNDIDGTKTNDESNIADSEETILYESEGDNVPYVIKQLEPEISGVVVVCDGGDDVMVVNKVTNAVEALFSVSSYKIKVLKMN